MTDLSDDDTEAMERAMASTTETSRSPFDQVSVPRTVFSAVIGGLLFLISFSARAWFPTVFEIANSPEILSPIGTVEAFGILVVKVAVFILGWPLILGGCIAISYVVVSLFVIGYRNRSKQEDRDR